MKQLVNVPWYETTASDEATYVPSEQNSDDKEVTSEQVKERFSDLGYR